MGPDAVAILIGARLVTRSNDTEYPFRQDSDFWYLTGFDHPDAVAVLRTDGGPAFTLFVQPRDRDAETWNGYRPGVDGAKADYGADEAHPIDELPAKIPELLGAAERLHHAVGVRTDLDHQITDEIEKLRRSSKQGLAPPGQIVDPRSLTHEMRLFKEPEEVELMRQAARISAEAHRDAARIARDGTFEYELEAALSFAFRRRGGSGPAYAPIVAGGSGATVLHYIANDQPLRDGELVLIDAGVELQGYASDVTRTYPVGGRFARPHRDVYEIVLASQTAALDAAKPGATLPDVHKAALRVLVDGMVGLGLLSGTVDDLIAEEAYRPYYMHGTSHWLGLDVHDVGIYARGDEPRKLEPGMAFTIEPGLYVAADAEAAPEALRGIGVRIEDDVVVTADGIENLNEDIPKRPDDVEAWMRD